VTSPEGLFNGSGTIQVQYRGRLLRVEQVLDEYWGSPSAEMVIRAFIAPCFFEALNVELRDITHEAGDGPATEMAVALERLMGPRSKLIWAETYV
jgi:hypothetical protein